MNKHQAVRTMRSCVNSVRGHELRGREFRTLPVARCQHASEADLASFPGRHQLEAALGHDEPQLSLCQGDKKREIERERVGWTTFAKTCDTKLPTSRDQRRGHSLPLAFFVSSKEHADVRLRNAGWNISRVQNRVHAVLGHRVDGACNVKLSRPKPAQDMSGTGTAAACLHVC